MQMHTTMPSQLPLLIGKGTDISISPRPPKQSQETQPELDSKPNVTDLWPIKPTEVYNAFWRFAAERQAIFFRKLKGCPAPWTHDPILLRHKFTNAYRASDRVSQYLIKHVIYCGNQSPEEVFFRILLFKVFNRIETWELLQRRFGEIAYTRYSFREYDEALTEAMETGSHVFSAAYIMPPGQKSFGQRRKHSNYLRLLEKMMADRVPLQIGRARLMREVFELLRSYPLLGDFLAYQYSIDLNYSELTDFSEMDFVVPGPGARAGIRKCFMDYGGLNEVDLIRVVADHQVSEFDRLGIEFCSLYGRPLQLIDCQNLFCEIDKYARQAYPNVGGGNGRKRIKQVYRPRFEPISYWYPPKWGINDKISSSQVPNMPCG